MSDLSKGKILVTGGAGFIGSALIWALNSRGFDNILVADRLTTDEKWRNLSLLRFDDYVSADDLLDAVRSEAPALNDIRWVFHLGACASTTERDLAFLMNNNYGYTRQLCEWSVRRAVRFVYASSAATYGDGSQGMDEDESGINRLRPLNAYGFSKQLFDLHARRRGYLGQVVGLKYFNVFGPNEAHKGEMRSLVSKAFDQLQQTGKIELFKSCRPEFRDGEQKRDFLYVKDAVDMTIHLAIRQDTAGLFNLGSGQARTWIDLATAVFAALGKKPEIEFIEMPDVLRGKYQYFTQANIAKLMATGYQGPRYSLETAVADYVQNYLAPGKNLEAS